MSIRFTLLVSLAFASAYGLAPLFYSNQNQYFLHGFAYAEYGYLHHDWLAETTDPTPFFSHGIEWVVRHLPLETLIAAQFLMLAAYAWGLLRIGESLFGGEKRWLFATLLVLIHSAGARWLSYRLLGQDYPWYFQAGVAGQYVTGAMFQPSVFGILLVLGISEYLRGRTILASFLIAATGTIHPTYLLPGAMLTLGFLFHAVRSGNRLGALRLGLLTLVLVLPVSVHSWQSFAPTSPEFFREAQRILIDVRIPHHARVDLWLDPVATVQILWIVLGIGLTWGTPLFGILAVPFGLGATLTVIQVATGSDSLALLFPWRISAVLMPIATAVVLARLARWSLSPAIAAAVLVLLGGVGFGISLGRAAFHTPDEELGLLEKVRSIRREGQVYAIPVRVPNPANAVRGSASSDFKPLAEKKNNAGVIPIDLQRFRLATGAPILIDFKSIPYKDVEVVDWLERLLEVEKIYRLLSEGKIDVAMIGLSKNTVTHLVWPRSRVLNDRRLKLIYEDEAYQLFEVISE